MKAVLISIQPKWCEKIANGEKTIEVRKSRPKLETPFKVYIYCTNDRKVFLDSDCNNKFWTEKNYGGKHYYNGKVIGEFVCDRIDNYIYKGNDNKLYWSFPDTRDIERVKKESCLTIGEIIDYTGDSDNCYFWHITDLKIYNKPKELSEFGNLCRKDCLRLGKGKSCEFLSTDGTPCNRIIPITRPPQSWCYVEELQNG